MDTAKRIAQDVYCKDYNENRIKPLEARIECYKLDSIKEAELSAESKRKHFLVGALIGGIAVAIPMGIISCIISVVKYIIHLW